MTHFELSFSMHLHRHHTLATGLLSWITFALILQSSAQVPIPATKHPITGGGSSSAGVAPKAPEKPLVKTITYLVMSEPRQWTSTDGKPLLAKLIAYEEIVTTGTAAAPTTPPVASPTLIKEGRIRLLVNNKPFELALDRLSQSDRDYIEKLQTAIQKKAVPAK